MTNTWFISDTHFGHTKCWEVFKNNDGTPLRPFSSTEEMDETMAERWNEVVKPDDKVIHLGDVVINKKFLPILNRLNGSKRLVAGNHDLYHMKHLREYFVEIYPMRVYHDFICSHIPLHPEDLPRFGTNVHGHLHGNRVRVAKQVPTLPGSDNTTIDPRYFSVCVEQIDYRPIHIDELRKQIAEQQEKSKLLLPTMYEQMKGNKPWGNGSGPG